MMPSLNRDSSWMGSARNAALAAVLLAAPSGCGVDRPPPAAGPEDLTALKGVLGTPECLARAINEIHLQAVLLLDDAARSNCSAADPCTTAADVASFVTLANQVFAPARVRFNFNPALDFAEVVNPDLNGNLDPNNRAGNWNAANAIAASFTGKVVVLLRKTATSDFAYPPDTGQAVPVDAPFPTTFAGVQPNFIAFEGRETQARPNARGFAQVLGHFLGLYHPYLTWDNSYPAVPPADGCPKANGSPCTPDELDQAIINLQNARGPGALDGDRLTDTPEDPGPIFWSANGLDPALVGTVVVGSTVYTPDLQNLMSGFGGTHLTAGQVAAIQSSVCDPRRANLASAPQARCRDVTLTAPAGTCSATGLTAAQVDNGSSDPNGDGLTLTLDRTGPFPAGITPVRLLVSDGTFSAVCTANVTVTDGVRPTITPPPKVTTTICTNDPINVGVATATDNCGTPTVTGQVIVSNGISLTPPIPVVNGRAQIGPGTHVIRWIASDGANLAVTTQTVVVQAAIEATSSFLVDDRATVRDAATGAGAGIFNSGTGQTRVGFDARTGGILSVGPVQVSDRATVSGGVRSAGGLDISGIARIAGERAALAQVALPAIPALPAFPAATGGNIQINSGNRRTLSAGSFGSVNATSGATLILGSGDFFFQNLTINSGALVRVTATTRIFVRDSFSTQAPFLASAGTAVQPIFFGFAGSTIAFDAAFSGTLVAPNATVFFGTGGGMTFTGAFYARTIEVRPQSTLVCQTSAATL